MHKIDTDTAVDGEFVNGDKTSGINATKLNASWFNTVQRELVKVVEAAGLALSDQDDTQVNQAIALLAISSVLSGSHTGSLHIVDNAGNNAEMSTDGFSVDFVKAGISLSADNEGFHFTFKDEDGNDVKVTLGETISIGDNIHIQGGASQLNSLSLLKNLTVYGTLVTMGMTASETSVKIAAPLKVSSASTFGGTVGNQVTIENGSAVADVGVAGSFLKASQYVDAGNVCCSNIYNATTESTLLNPSTLLAGCARTGAMALVKNATGNKVYIDRQGDGSNYMHLVVNSGEILLYVYNGSEWVHAW